MPPLVLPSSIKPYYQEEGIAIIHGDCHELLPRLTLVDLIIADPPYGAGQASWDHTKPEASIWDLLMNSLIDGGCLYYWGFWGHADWILTHAKRVGLLPQSRIVWWFRTGRPEIHAYREDTEDAYYFSRGVPKTFNADAGLEPYEDLANYQRYGRAGKHPGTVWKASRILHNHPENYGHVTQKPQVIIGKMLAISSNPGDTILDPYMGSGTTLRLCKELHRCGIGIDSDEAFCEMSANRLRQGVLDLAIGT